jgi:hypothetical protein
MGTRRCRNRIEIKAYKLILKVSAVRWASVHIPQLAYCIFLVQSTTSVYLLERDASSDFMLCTARKSRIKCRPACQQTFRITLCTSPPRHIHTPFTLFDLLTCPGGQWTWESYRHHQRDLKHQRRPWKYSLGVFFPPILTNQQHSGFPEPRCNKNLLM